MGCYPLRGPFFGRGTPGCSSSYPSVAVLAHPQARSRLLHPAAPRPAPPTEPSPPPGTAGWSRSPCPSSPAFLHPWAMLASVPSFPSPPQKLGGTRGKPISHVRFGLVLSASFSSEEESSSSSSSSAEGSASAREEAARLSIHAWTLPKRKGDRSIVGWWQGTVPSGAAGAGWGGAGMPGERCASPPAQPGLTVPAVPLLSAHGHRGAICPQR